MIYSLLSHPVPFLLSVKPYQTNLGKQRLRHVRKADRVMGFTNTSEAPHSKAFSRSARRWRQSGW